MVGHFIKHKPLITEEWAHICLPFPMRPLHQMRSSKSRGKKRKKCNLSGTHSFQGKKWSEEINHGRKSVGKNTKTKNQRNIFWIWHQYTLNLAKEIVLTDNYIFHQKSSEFPTILKRKHETTTVKTFSNWLAPLLKNKFPSDEKLLNEL